MGLLTHINNRPWDWDSHALAMVFIVDLFCAPSLPTPPKPTAPIAVTLWTSRVGFIPIANPFGCLLLHKQTLLVWICCLLVYTSSGQHRDILKTHPGSSESKQTIPSLDSRRTFKLHPPSFGRAKGGHECNTKKFCTNPKQFGPT